VPEALKDGRFVIVGSLGEGSQGHTFDGVDKREGRAVAIKRFDVRGAKTWKDAELAEREARVLQSLSHPKLPKYFDHFEENGALYLVMEKIEGESLASLQKRGATLSEGEVVRLLQDASVVLEYLHRRGVPVIHRDLKPGNVIRRPDGSFAFVDFGAVRDKLRPEGGSTVVGTFGYMAPEQFQGRALPSSDVYAIGATALSMLTGIQPENLPHKGLGLDVRAALGHRVRGPIVEVLSAMLDPDPDRRPARIALVLPKLEERGRPRPSDRAAPSRMDVLSERLAQKAAEYEERAREHERRARDGGPGARGWLHGAEQWHKAARRLRRDAARHLEKVARDVSRDARRELRKGARRAERASRHRNGPHTEGHRPPWPVAVLVALMFTAGMVAVAIATQVVVPTLLRFLSVFFASRALTEAAQAVHAAGESAMIGMDRSRRWFMGHDAHEPDRAPGDERIRVGEERIRVDATSDRAEEFDEEDRDPTKANEAKR
jgi:hypothetical protein